MSMLEKIREYMLEKAKQEIDAELSELAENIAKDPTHAYSWIFAQISDWYEEGLIVKLSGEEYRELLRIVEEVFGHGLEKVQGKG